VYAIAVNNYFQAERLIAGVVAFALSKGDFKMRTVRLVIVAAVFCVAGFSLGVQVSPRAQDVVGPAVAISFGHLSHADQVKISEFLWGLNKESTASCQEDAEIWRSSKEYFKNQGWEPRSLLTDRVNDNKDLLVVRELRLPGRPEMNGSFTDYIPLSFPRFVNGTYLVRPLRSGGVSEIIAEGKTYSFAVADWKDWPRQRPPLRIERR
jgi:hypothetical protein